MASVSLIFYQHGWQVNLKMIISDNKKQAFMGKLRGLKEIGVWFVIKCQQLSEICKNLI